MKKPETRAELKQLEKENNIIVKINSKSSLNGMYPAFKKVCRFDGYLDKWDVYFIAAKQYHSLLDGKMISSIGYDKMMGKLKAEYIDYAKREVRIFKTEKAAIKYLKN